MKRCCFDGSSGCYGEMAVNCCSDVQIGTRLDTFYLNMVPAIKAIRANSIAVPTNHLIIVDSILDNATLTFIRFAFVAK